MRSFVANGGYAAVFANTAYFVIRAQDPEVVGVAIARVAGVGVLYYGACATHGWFLYRRNTREVSGWLQRGGPPNEQVRAELLALPRRSAIWTAAYWVGFGIWVLPFLENVTPYHLTPVRTGTAVGSIILGATMGPALTYLLVERGQRDVRAIIMRGVPNAPVSRTGIRGRLLIVFALAIVMPMAQLSLAVVGTKSSQVELFRQFVWAGAVFVIVAGLAVAIITARAISDPLRRIRLALGRVKEGDFTSELDVNEVGEFGEVQAGFNDMVAGLRERERMRDVFGRHVGPEVAQRALEDKFVLGGETREATAMFVDVIGSTALAQREAPSEVVEKLNAFFDAVIRSVGVEGGLVNKFHGDGALCVFGVPADQPDHAARALRAARRLTSELASMDGVTAAIGVSSGEVVAGNVGALDRYEYTVIGDPVNEASRLTDEAKLRSSRVLASSTTIDCAADEAEHWHDAGTFALRGRATPTLAYEPA
jgi:adenylate cyclase